MLQIVFAVETLTLLDELNNYVTPAHPLKLYHLLISTSARD